MYRAEQTEIVDSPHESEDERKIDWAFGPVSLQGVLDVNVLDVTLLPSVCGIYLGTMKGNAKDGLGVNLDLHNAKGQIKMYLKNGNEMWTHLDVSITFDGSFQGDYKIFSF